MATGAPILIFLCKFSYFLDIYMIVHNFPVALTWSSLEMHQ